MASSCCVFSICEMGRQYSTGGGGGGSGIQRAVKGLPKFTVELKSEGWLLLLGVGLMQHKRKATPAAGPEG